MRDKSHYQPILEFYL